MDFADSTEHAAFRAEFRRWLDENLPADIKVDDAADQRVAADRETLEKRILWQKRMHAAGWVGISWPREYGGRGADVMQQVIFDEEYFRARAPVLPTASALNLLGPTLMHWGSEAQKRRHLPRILAADELWCQGYSEPGGGADPASLRTRAVDRGDHFLVNGQKVWTSGAHYADWCFLLTRTDPEAPKHHGISYLLVDMKTPGISVRPLVLLNGHRHFNEVFFDDVAVPKGNLVGPLNQGWKVAITTLMFERSGAGGRDHAAELARLAELAKGRRLSRGGTCVRHQGRFRNDAGRGRKSGDHPGYHTRWHRCCRIRLDFHIRKPAFNADRQVCRVADHPVARHGEARAEFSVSEPDSAPAVPAAPYDRHRLFRRIRAVAGVSSGEPWKYGIVNRLRYEDAIAARSRGFYTIY
jgi:alkylation response protein AidB-like acyl-CoA dehydrogenase